MERSPMITAVSPTSERWCRIAPRRLALGTSGSVGAMRVRAPLPRGRPLASSLPDRAPVSRGSSAPSAEKEPPRGGARSSLSVMAVDSTSGVTVAQRLDNAPQSR